MNVTVKQLRSFRAVVEMGGFGRAATALGTSQPVVSAHVREMEAALGVRLIERTTRRLALTEEGAAFLLDAGEALARLEGAVERVQGLAAARLTRLRVAAPPVMAASLLPPVIAAHAAAHPEVAVELFDAPTEEMVRALQARRVDAVLGTVPEEVAVGSRHVLLRDRLMLFVPHGSDLTGAAPVAWSELERRDVVQLRPGSGIRRLVDREAARQNTPLATRYEVVNVMTALAMVEARLGVAILPSYVATGLERRGIEALVLDGTDMHREFVLVTSPSDPAPPTVGPFLHLLRRHLNRVGLPDTATGRPL